MKIATWNVERLKHKKSLKEIISACEQVKASILVLTETDEQIQPNYQYCFHTPTPPDVILPPYTVPLHYEPTEHRISIFTNYKCVQQHKTYDNHTALCVEMETEKGSLLVYGTIIGIHGNRRPSFMEDLMKQTEDYKRLSSERAICVCGDFNCSFADNYYYTKDGRNQLLQSFDDNDIELLTANQPSCIDHIAVSKSYVRSNSIAIEEWNQEKELSDHKGIAVEFA